MARLRQAWEAVQVVHQQADSIKKRSTEDPELDTLLGTVALDGIKERFWTRYKISFGVSTEPSDLSAASARR